VFRKWHGYFSAFSSVYSKNQKEKEWNDLKNLQFGQKGKNLKWQKDKIRHIKGCI
jgi:hypothetical protein